MVLVVIYLAIAFEWRMAVAALIALIHDLTITVGVYALVGFEVTPGTVIGLLTILGYSLYDTVVVFDGLKESTKDITKQTRFTYSEIANRVINGTLVRSINTTVVALLPVAGLLFIGGGVLGAGMLNDISLSLFVGLAAGAYSSIFIATPLVADLKEREPQMKALKKRVLAKRAQAAGQGRPVGDDPRATTTCDDEPDDADAAVVGPAPPARVPRGRGRGRPRASADDRLGDVRSCCSAASVTSPDYPKPGVMFKDITPLLADPAAFTALTDALAELCARARRPRRSSAWRRAASSSPPRSPSAPALGFIPVRKAGKLPGATLSARRTSWSTAPPRSRSTPRTWPRATACWSSTTSSPPAAPPRPRWS